MSRRMEQSRTFPVAVEHAYDVVLSEPLPSIFSRRYGAIPPIKSVDGQDGAWGAAVGQTRTIRLSDGGTMQETLTVIERPNRFSYSIGNVTGMMKPLVTGVDGEWAFEAVGTGTRITWTWVVHPTARLGRLAMPVFARLWAGYARQAMEQIEQILLR